MISENICLSGDEITIISNFKKDCDLTTMNMLSYKENFEDCINGAQCDDTITSSRAVFWSSVIGALVIGFMAGTHR